MSKLTEGTRIRAREMLQSGQSTREVARSLRVRRASISAIKSNLTRSSDSGSTTRVNTGSPRVFGFNPGVMVEGSNAAEARARLVDALNQAGFLWDDNTLGSYRVSRSVWNESQNS